MVSGRAVAAHLVAMTTQTTTTPNPSATDHPILDAHQRCDRCGAQAYTRYHHPDRTTHDLQFCLHHTRLHHEGLGRQGFERSVDESSRLVASKSQSD